MEKLKTIGDRLNKASEVLFEGNKSAMARELSITPQSLNKYIREGQIPGGEMLFRFTLIGLNINWILTGDGEMLAPHPDSVQEPAAAYNKANATDQALLHARAMLEQSDISQERQLELIREFTKTIAIEQNQAYFDNLSKK